MTQTTMTAQDFCRLVAGCYRGKPDEHRVSIGDWDVIEPDPAKMTIYTLPKFSADISITVGEIRQMAGMQKMFDPTSKATTWQDRIDAYQKATGFPQGLFVGGDGRVVGTWIMGNDYRVQTGYYGGYPAGYLRRIKSMFPDKRRVLHLFAGKVDLAALPGDTVDINPDLSPTYVDDAQRLERVPLADYDLVMADPPYSVEDCERYQTTMVKRNVVMQALARLPPGAHVVWLDQVLPMYRKDTFAIEAVIGMVKSTNHRFRVVTIFRKLETLG